MSQQPFDVSLIDELARDLEPLVDSESATTLLGRELSALAARIPSEEQVTSSAVVRLALLNDVLRIAETAILADDTITPEEVAYVQPLVREALKYLGRFRHVYKDAYDADAQGTLQFLQQHAKDRQMFGGKCTSTQWIGVSICRKAEELSGDSRFTDAYRAIALRALDDLFDGVNSGPAGGKTTIAAELLEVLPLRRQHVDPREAAYCAPDSPEVFHAIAHEADVFEHDPFDVETIHASARQAFARLLSRSPQAKAGRMLLVNGESGSGKTHLMRAFRNVAHGEQLGVVAYMQMSTQVTNYARYILSNTISSWEHPFWGTAIQDSALVCLSDSVARDLPLHEQEVLQDDSLPNDELDAVANRAADRLVGSGKYASVHVDVVRMMLYLRRRDPARRSRVMKFLRCEMLSPHDRTFVGGVATFEYEEGPARMLTELGRLIAVTENGAMVLLVDQVEDMFNLPEDGTARFRLAMDALRHLTDHVPTSVIVVACLEDYYVKMRGVLSKPVLDRLERDPEPARLTSGRTLAEIEEMLERRLAYLFEQRRVTVRLDDPRFPFRNEQLVARANQRTRDVLDWARRHHDASIHAGRIIEPEPESSSLKAVAPAGGEFAQKWNDHRTATLAPPDDESARLALLSWAIEGVSRELEPAREIRARADGVFIDVHLKDKALTTGLCNKASKGGGLANQVEALLQRATGKKAIPIVLRGTEYPPPGESKVAQRLKSVLQSGGSKLIVADAEWRAMHALSTFEKIHGIEAGYASWLRTERPLSSVPALRAMLGLDDITRPARGVSGAVPPAPVATSAPSKVSRDDEGAVRSVRPEAVSFVIGETRGLVPQKVTVAPSSFVTHAAFLGSSGSGKTTLALRILEELASHRVPVLMLDRKGDLSRYGSPEFWDKPESDPALAAAKRALAERLDVRVYTPGEPRGRGLKLSVVPSGLQDLPAHDRGMVSRYAASALGAMMGYRKTSKSDETRLGILGKAIELVGRVPARDELGIAQLVTVLDDEDPDLVSAVGRLDPKHFHALVENLETLRLRYDHVLRGEGERLSPELLFGLDEPRGSRTRVTIVSTKSLGDNAAVDFWVARLLGDLSRWASQHPSGALQAVVFLDEADLYLPAQSKPATKEPMLDLLKRARSAGLGVFLATQSPGDLDYRCRDNIRTWFVGRVAEKTAVDKMKPLLSECRTNIVSKLGSAKIGEFFKLQDGDVTEFRALQSIMQTEQVPEDEILRIARNGAQAN